MTKEQIRAAAINAANEVYDREECIEWEHLVFAFRDGAQWRINSVWHDVNERPKFPGEVECVKFLLLRKNGECDRYLIGKYNWDDIINMEKPIKWAYIDDFLPERKEGNNVQ